MPDEVTKTLIANGITQAALEAMDAESRALTAEPIADKKAYEAVKAMRTKFRNLRTLTERLFEPWKKEQHDRWKTMCTLENSFTTPIEQYEERFKAAEKEFVTREERERRERFEEQQRTIAERKRRVLAIGFVFDGQRYFYHDEQGEDLEITKEDIENPKGNNIDFGEWIGWMDTEVQQRKEKTRLAKEAEAKRLEDIAIRERELERKEQQQRFLDRSNELAALKFVYDEVDGTYCLGSIHYTVDDIRAMSPEDFGRATEHARGEALRMQQRALAESRCQQLFGLNCTLNGDGWNFAGTQLPQVPGQDMHLPSDEAWEAIMSDVLKAIYRINEEYERIKEERRIKAIEDQKQAARIALEKEQRDAAEAEQRRIANASEREKYEALRAMVSAINIPDLAEPAQMQQCKQLWLDRITQKIATL